MPSVVSAVVTAVKAFASWYATQEAWVRLAITLGSTLAIDAASRKLFGGKLSKSNKDFSRDITVRGAVQARKIVYGEALVSGPMIYTNVSGTDNKYLWLAVALAGHEVSGMTDVWLDGTEITNANVNWGSAVSGGDYATYATFHKQLGTTTQAAQTELAQAFSDITVAHTGKEIAYIVGRFELLEESAAGAFESGPPQNISALVQGKLMYDPRLDSTHARYQGGVGTHRVATPSTWSYSDNPALCWADYLIDSRIGAGFATAKIDYDSVADEADYCEGQVQDEAGVLQDRFTCNGVLYTTDTHRDNAAKILTSMNGKMSYRAGKFVVRAGRMGEGPNVITPATFNASYSVGSGTAATESSVVTSAYSYHVSYQIKNYSSGGIRVAVGGTNGQTAGADGWFNEVIESAGTGVTLDVPATFVGDVANLEIHLVSIKDVNEDWLAGDVQIKTAPPKASRTNTYHAIIKDPARNYKDSETLEVTQTAYTDRDGEILRKEVGLPMTNSEIMAQRILFKRLFATDQQKTVVLRCNYKALQLAPHDFIRVSLAELSWVDKIFRIASWSFADLGDGGGVDLVLQEDDSSAYAEVEPSQYSARTAAGVVVVGSQGVPSFSNLTATSVFQGIQIHADMPTPRSAWTHGVLYASPDSAWGNAVEIARGSYGTTFLHKLDAGEVRYYWLKAFRDAEEGLREPNSDTSTVTATAGGEDYGQTFYQSTAPSGVGELDGDMWVDSDDDKWYRRISAAWVEIQDDDIAQALIDAAAAQAGADQKIQSFYQDSPPSGQDEDEGDIWIDTNDGDKMYMYDTGAWVNAQDNDVAQAITDAADAQSTADGKITTFIQTSAPSAEGAGDFWLDTDDNNRLYRAGAAGSGSWADYNITAIGADGQTTLSSAASVVGDPGVLSEVGGAFHGLGATAIYCDGTASGASPGIGITAVAVGLNSVGGYFWSFGTTPRSALRVEDNHSGGLALEVSDGDSEFNDNIDIFNVAQIQTNGGFDTTRTVDSSSVSTGTIVCDGGMGLAKKLYLGGNLRHTDTTDSSSDTTGAAVFSGGVGIAKKLFVGGDVSLGDSVTDTVAVGGATHVGTAAIAIKSGSGGSKLSGQIAIYGDETTGGLTETTLGITAEYDPVATGSFTLSHVWRVYINAVEYDIGLDKV